MKRRVLMGLLLDGKTGRAFHAPIEPSTDEFEAITRRQAMRVLEPAPPDKREPGRLVAAICIGVCIAALFVATIMEVLKIGR